MRLREFTSLEKVFLAGVTGLGAAAMLGLAAHLLQIRHDVVVRACEDGAVGLLLAIIADAAFALLLG